MLKPAWTAGTTRAVLLLGRRLGEEQLAAVARAGSLAGGVAVLAASSYGARVRERDDLAAAERGVAETLLWHLRILAGWLPASGARLMRALAARFELENIDARLAALAGDGREPPPFELGGLASAWPRVAPARTLHELRSSLAGTAWGAQSGSSAAELALGLRVAWARRLAATAPEAARWVAGAGALLAARELFVAGERDRTAQLRGLPGIPDAALRAASLEQLRAELPASASWSLRGVREPHELWRAELGWWRRVGGEAPAMLRGREQRAAVIGATALLALDAQRAARALAAADAGTPELVEIADGAA